MSYSRAILLAELERDEQLRGKVYDDKTSLPIKAGDKVLGKLTVGIGRNLQDVGLTPEEARMLCSNDVDRVEKELSTVVPFWRGLSDARQRALLNMCFNLGAGGLAKFKNMLAAIESGEFDRASTEMRNSVWASQVGERAQRLIVMMQHG